ncbi:hypothetical protein [Nocardia cyriacigeorgica]|uniref:Uncharacterized protein n=1 Tax=Nocardia cyriacigeorgica (strain GUH-2) TaxID=1127134 RepID=H6RAV2_NOCCG|nr:hypothetical protein [Nocardia cyriacigeorgica]BDT84605.1 hypothetical protein FMUAM8_03690 [Nocardia cyriacigeorgica]CCF61191.1 protein of unknown function [Nocardia cyriacigeorgica GUH-2]
MNSAAQLWESVAAHRSAVELCKQLEIRKVTLPANVVEARERLDALAARKPEAPAPDLVSTLYAAGVGDAEINAAATDRVIAKEKLSGWTAAHNVAGRGLRKALHAACDDLTEQLAALAEPLIDDLHAVAEAGQGQGDLSALVLDGRHEEAERIARLDRSALELKALYDLRLKLTPPGCGYAVGVIDCGIWRDPRPVRNGLGEHRPEGLAEFYLAGIRAGGQLWFPHHQEAADMATAIYKAEEEKKPKRQEVSRGGVAFT